METQATACATTEETDITPVTDPKKEKKKKRRRRLGDRADGRRIRTLEPASRISPYIMKIR